MPLLDSEALGVATERHYSDVPLIKGVYRGTASAELEASVRMQRTDATGARA